MTKSDFLTAVKANAAANEVTVTKKDLDVIMAAFEKAIMDGVKAGEKVKAFGVTYSSKEVPERRGTIMLGDRKGEEYVTPAHTAGCVKASKALKELFA